MPPQRVAQVWPFVSDDVMRAVIRGGNGSYAEIAADVLTGRDRLWLAVEQGRRSGSVVTSLTRDAGDGRAVCVITACAGRFHRHLLAQIEAWAWAQGCRAIRIYGRKGWRRRLPDYRPFKEGLQKELL